MCFSLLSLSLTLCTDIRGYILFLPPRVSIKNISSFLFPLACTCTRHHLVSRGICLHAGQAPRGHKRDYVSRLRARPELESAGLHDKTCGSRERASFQSAKGRRLVLSYEPAQRGIAPASVTQAAWNCMEELEIIHRCHQANWRVGSRSSSSDERAADRSTPTWIRRGQESAVIAGEIGSRDASRSRCRTRVYARASNK